MLRFIKHHIATEDGASFFGILSLLIYVGFFLVVLFLLARMKKERITELSNTPFDNDELPVQNDTK